MSGTSLAAGTVPVMMSPYHHMFPGYPATPMMSTGSIEHSGLTHQHMPLPGAYVSGDLRAYAALTRNWQMQQYHQAALQNVYSQHQEQLKNAQKINNTVNETSQVKSEVMSPDSSTCKSGGESKSQEKTPEYKEASSESDDDETKHHVRQKLFVTPIKPSENTESFLKSPPNTPIISPLERKRKSPDNLESASKKVMYSPYVSSYPVPPQTIPSAPVGYFSPYGTYNPYSPVATPIHPYYKNRATTSSSAARLQSTQDEPLDLSPSANIHHLSSPPQMLSPPELRRISPEADTQNPQNRKFCKYFF